MSISSIRARIPPRSSTTTARAARPSARTANAEKALAPKPPPHPTVTAAITAWAPTALERRLRATISPSDARGRGPEAVDVASKCALRQMRVAMRVPRTATGSHVAATCFPDGPAPTHGPQVGRLPGVARTACTGNWLGLATPGDPPNSRGRARFGAPSLRYSPTASEATRTQTDHRCPSLGLSVRPAGRKRTSVGECT